MKTVEELTRSLPEGWPEGYGNPWLASDGSWNCFGPHDICYWVQRDGKVVGRPRKVVRDHLLALVAASAAGNREETEG